MEGMGEDWTPEEAGESRPSVSADTLWDRIMAAVTLKPEVYRELGADQSATGQAAIVVVAAALISGLSVLIGPGRFGIGAWIGGAVFAIIIFAIWVGLLWLIAKLFDGQADYMSLFRGLGFAYAPVSLGIVPIIGGIVGGIWALVAAIIGVREIESFTTGKAAAVVLIPVAVLFVIGLLLAAVAGFALMGMLGGQ